MIEIIRTKTFPKDYRDVAEQCAQGNIFSSTYWFDNFLQTVVSPEDEVIWIGCKSSSNEPLLLLPLWRKAVNNRWCVKRLMSLSNYYTTLYEPLYVITDEKQLEHIIDQIAEAVCQLKWDVIDLCPLDSKSSSYQLLVEAFKRQSKHVSQYFMYGNWFLLTQNRTYAEYFATRPTQLKNTIKRKINKLKTKNLEYVIHQRPEKIEDAVLEFQQIYLARWKRNEPYSNFISGLAKVAAEQGWLRLGLLYIDKQAVAAQIWLTVGKTAYIYKLCQIPEFDSYSPGTLLTAYLMEYVFKVDQVAKIDFLSGDDQYKENWMSHRGERWGLQIANQKTFFGLMKAARNRLAIRLKQ